VSVEWPLRSLVPQSGGMVLIDDPFDAGDGWVTASVAIGEDSMFYKPAMGVPSWVGAEYMAQTISLYAGVCAARIGSEIKIGFLLGMRRYTVGTDYFCLGSDLRINAKEIWQDGQMAVFDCTIADQSGAGLAAAALNVFQPTDPAAFLEEQKE
jgi:predicted hotdog family 3-hydroxylacyl-ACP dehydratase